MVSCGSRSSAARLGRRSRGTGPRPGCASYQLWAAAWRIASPTEASPLRTDARALPTTARSAALSGERNGWEGIGESDAMAAAYGRAKSAGQPDGVIPCGAGLRRSLRNTRPTGPQPWNVAGPAWPVRNGGVIGRGQAAPAFADMGGPKAEAQVGADLGVPPPELLVVGSRASSFVGDERYATRGWPHGKAAPAWSARGSPLGFGQAWARRCTVRGRRQSIAAAAFAPSTLRSRPPSKVRQRTRSILSGNRCSHPVVVEETGRMRPSSMRTAGSMPTTCRPTLPTSTRWKASGRSSAYSSRTLFLQLAFRDRRRVLPLA